MSISWALKRIQNRISTGCNKSFQRRSTDAPLRKIMFQNAKIIGKAVRQAEYQPQPCERGEAGYAMSSSALRLFDACPSKWVRGFNPPASQSLEYGSLLDCVVLTPEHFKDVYALQPDTYETTGMECPNCKSVTDSKRCSKCKCERVEVKITKPWSNQSTTCAAWTEAQKQAGKEVCTAAELADAQAAAKRLFSDPIIGDYINESDKQVWIAAEWHDAGTGLVVPVKCLVDLLPRRTSEFFDGAGDLKSTKCAKKISWERFAEAVGYNVQGAWNIDLVQAALPNESRRNFSFILSENHHPWEPSREMMENDDDPQSSSLMANARAKYRRIMANYCQCLKHKKWPGYADNDEASDGWNIWRQDPWSAERDMFAPRYNFAGEETQPEETEEAEIVDFRH